MGVGTFIHHIGTFFLFVATILLVVASISSPVVNDIAVFKVHLGDNAGARSINFGTFGYCLMDVTGSSKDHCSKSHIGYNPANVVNSVENTDFSQLSSNTAKDLTNVMVLHPVGAGISFIAFLLCLGTGFVGSFIGSIFAGIAFIVAAVAVICDFVAFSGFKHDINHHTSDGRVSGNYSVAIWLVLAAGVCDFIAAILVFFTCCAGKIRDKRHAKRRSQKGWTDDAPNGRF